MERLAVVQQGNAFALVDDLPRVLHPEVGNRGCVGVVGDIHIDVLFLFVPVACDDDFPVVLGADFNVIGEYVLCEFCVDDVLEGVCEFEVFTGGECQCVIWTVGVVEFDCDCYLLLGFNACHVLFFLVGVFFLSTISCPLRCVKGSWVFGSDVHVANGGT